jgi:mannose-1-phosphate guanylyltransferase
VKRFAEKPALALARRYVASKKYLWNAGMFFWLVSTFMENLERYIPATHAALLELAKTIGTRKYASALATIYPKLENISVDYAIMEPATRAAKNHVSVIPASVGWSDIGSWSAVYDLLTKTHGTNLAASDCFTHDAEGNYFHSHKFVAAIGVHNLVLVETDDAILICPRDRSQDVGKIVKWLEQEKRSHLL